MAEGSATASFNAFIDSLLSWERVASEACPRVCRTPCSRPLLEPLDRRDEQTIFDIVVRRQVALAGEDVKQHAVQFVGAARGVITDDDPLQFGEFRLDLVVVPAEYVDRITLGMLPGAALRHGENFLFLIVHVLVHFGDVLVEEPQDGESHVVMAAIDRLDQLAADGRKPEIEEIDMQLRR